MRCFFHFHTRLIFNTKQDGSLHSKTIGLAPGSSCLQLEERDHAQGLGREAASPGEGFGEAPPRRRDYGGRGFMTIRRIWAGSGRLRVVNSSKSREVVRRGSVALRFGGTRQADVHC